MKHVKTVVFIFLVSIESIFRAAPSADELVKKNNACTRNPVSSICITIRRAELNIEVKAALEINPSAVFKMIRSEGVAPNALMACRALVNRQELQRNTVLQELTPTEREALKFSRIENFDALPNGNIRCEYLGRTLVGVPGAYALGGEESLQRRGSISQCLPEIVRLANTHGLTLLRQTSEIVAFKFPYVGEDISDGSFGCSWLKPIINVTASYKSCKPPASFYEDIANLVGVRPNIKPTIIKHLQECTRRAEREPINHFSRRYGYETTCTYISPRQGRTSSCEIGISIYPNPN